MLITASDVDEVVATVGGSNPRAIFSPEKSLDAYKLSQVLDNRKRGKAAELLVVRELRLQHKMVRHIGGRSPFDILMGNRRKFRVEVKSSLATASIIGGKVRYSYNFRNIKPENFDSIIFVFIFPEGLVFRGMSKSKLYDKLAYCNRYSNGYVLSVGHDATRSLGRQIAA